QEGFDLRDLDGLLGGDGCVATRLLLGGRFRPGERGPAQAGEGTGQGRATADNARAGRLVRAHGGTPRRRTREGSTPSDHEAGVSISQRLFKKRLLSYESGKGRGIFLSVERTPSPLRRHHGRRTLELLRPLRTR